MPKDNVEPGIKDLIHFLESAPTAWHAVDVILKRLKHEGFEILQEDQSWKLSSGKAYAVVRNGSICAFVVPTQAPKSVKVAGAHTDSPSFKVKPNAEFLKENMIMLGLEVYGGPLLTSWLNRDLGIAGRILYKNSDKHVHEALVRLDDNPVVLPQLAIHLDRNVNDNGLVLNKQEHLAALAAIISSDKKKKSPSGYLETWLKKHVNFHTLLAYDLLLYPLEKPRLVGHDNQMLSAYRIDNLASVHSALSGLIKSKKPHKNALKMAAFWDHEEIGSHTAQGAGSPFLPQILERICLSLKLEREDYFRINNNGLCVSVDMTHALHPNYPEKHEPRHLLQMDHGIVVKTNAQHRYASDARTASAIIDLCIENKIPFQKFVSRGDIPSGSTIGPIFAGLTGMPTVDIGCPQLSMHSCRELFACQDHLDMTKLLTAFFTG